VSYINIHQVDQSAIEGVVDKEPTHSMTDGEELLGAAKLLSLLDGLPEGEALVVWRNIF
jgi:hypothetical protein